jgi:hypothetical protein
MSHARGSGPSISTVAFSERFRATLTAVGVEPVRLRPSSPNCNPLIERFFRSLKEDCLIHCIPMGQAGLRHLVSQSPGT